MINNDRGISLTRGSSLAYESPSLQRAIEEKLRKLLSAEIREEPEAVYLLIEMAYRIFRAARGPLTPFPRFFLPPLPVVCLTHCAA